jgi:predicted ATP-dependent endonuclease of OLD family
MSIKITLENIGPITKADLNLGQITVIVGENNVGKSFVLKSVYSVFKAFEMERMLLEEEVFKALKSVKNALSARKNFVSDDVKKEIDQILKEVDLYLKSDFSIGDLGNIFEILDKTAEIVDRIDRTIDKALSNSKKDEEDNIFVGLVKIFIEGIIQTFSKIELKKLQKEIKLLEKSEYRLKRAWEILIEDIFSRNIVKMDSEVGKIVIEDIVSFSFDGNIEVKFKDVWYSSILKPIFIESPILLEVKPYLAKTTERKIKSLEVPIHIGSFFDYVETISKIEEDDVLKDLRNIIGGEVYYNIEDGKFYYKSKYYDESFDIQNVASGIKSFGVLQLLLKSGAYENTIFFWEEPESHLHPEWQIKFAEIVAKIVKRNNYFVISTHSPFMVEILRVVAKENEIDARFYYMDKNSKLIEVNDENWDIISDSLLRPLRKIAYRLFRVV